MGEIGDGYARCEKCSGRGIVPRVDGTEACPGSQYCKVCDGWGKVLVDPQGSSREVPASEVDGGVLTPAECEAKMRADRDRAMRVALGFETVDVGKPQTKQPVPPDPGPDAASTAETDRIIQQSMEWAVRHFKEWEYRRAYGGFDV